MTDGLPALKTVVPITSAYELHLPHRDDGAESVVRVYVTTRRVGDSQDEIALLALPASSGTARLGRIPPQAQRFEVYPSDSTAACFSSNTPTKDIVPLMLVPGCWFYAAGPLAEVLGMAGERNFPARKLTPQETLEGFDPPDTDI